MFIRFVLVIEDTEQFLIARRQLALGLYSGLVFYMQFGINKFMNNADYQSKTNKIH